MTEDEFNEWENNQFKDVLDQMVMQDDGEDDNINGEDNNINGEDDNINGK
jgi:hypothetical protein